MEPLGNIDIVILIGFAISMFIAFLRGFVTEVLSIIGLILFVVLVVYLSPIMQPLFEQYIASKIMAQIVIFLVLMALFYAVWIIGTDKLVNRIRKSTLSFMDRLFGLIFGLFRALIVLGCCFLIIKIILPEELKKDTLKKSKFYVIAQTCSDTLESLLPENFIEDAMKSIEDMNKVEKETKEESTDKKTEENLKNLPTPVDQEQMNKIFEQLIKPEIKTDKKPEDKKEVKNDKAGYDSSETNNLDKLVDKATKN